MTAPSGIERLAGRLGIESGSRKLGRTTLLRFVLYYVVVIVVISCFIIVTDGMKALMTPVGRGAPNTGGSIAIESPEVMRSITTSLWAPLFHSLPPLAYGAAAVIGAFLLSVPIAFTYVRTRSRLKYDQSLVQTVIMLPVV
jgi:hypothetical protein